MIFDNLEEKLPKERILAKLQKRFYLTEKQAEEYYKECMTNDSSR